MLICIRNTNTKLNPEPNPNLNPNRNPSPKTNPKSDPKPIPSLALKPTLSASSFENIKRVDVSRVLVTWVTKSSYPTTLWKN